MSSLESIKCRAAVMYDYQKHLTLEDVITDAPKDDQVHVKLVSASVCLSDVITLEGKFKLSCQQLPIVPGHEGAGIVESVGENVTSVKPGDHVLVTYVTRCNNCNYCSIPLNTNFCAKQNVFLLGMIPNKKLAQTGKPLQSSAALGTFCEYILVNNCQVDKIDKLIKLDNLSPITCTGANAFGGSRNIAKVVPGTSVAVWGSCAFGLNTMFGAKLNGAKNIIAIDEHSDRNRLAQEFGCTEFINPQKLDKPVSEYLLEKYGGVDYAFDCNGEPENVSDGFKALTPFGTFTFVALTHSGTQVVQPTAEIAFGKKILGGFFGNRLSADMYGELLGMYKERKYDLDSMITHKFKLAKINEAFESVSSGKSVKTLIMFD